MHYYSRVVEVQNIRNLAVLGHLVPGREPSGMLMLFCEDLQGFSVVLVFGWVICVGL